MKKIIMGVIVFTLLIIKTTLAAEGQAIIDPNEQIISDTSNFILQNPKDVVAYNKRGVAYSNKKKYDLAIADYNKAIEINPNYAITYNNRGITYSSKGQYDLAIADFKKSIELNPQNANPYFNEADLYVKKKKYKEAIDTYYSFIAHVPHDRKNLEKAREKVNALGYFPKNESAEELKEKAEFFNQIVGTPIWVEKTIEVKEENIEKARQYAISSVKWDARKILLEKISQTDVLRIPAYSIDFFERIKVIKEDSSGNFGKLVKSESNGTETEKWKATFRFLVQCEQAKEINPFIKKAAYSKPSITKVFKEYDDYWEIVVVGYGFYESFEDIDFKVGIAIGKGMDSACKEIVKKVEELGITDKDTQEQIIKAIRAKKNYGGVYRVVGCGVEADAHIPIRIHKKDASVTFIYN